MQLRQFREFRVLPQGECSCFRVNSAHDTCNAGTFDAMERPEKEPEVKAQVGAHDSRCCTAAAGPPALLQICKYLSVVPAVVLQCSSSRL
jgi:hypothetical protein